MKTIILALFSCLSILASAATIDPSHAALTAILGKHVKPSGVDYAGLKKDPASLTAYLDTLTEVPGSTFKQWPKEQQMAMLINLYNAATLKLVVNNYPLKSIKEIGKLSGGPWKQSVVRLFGKNVSLDHIENNLLRPNYKDPRIHFAINCASIGCPALRTEAFQASKLNTQLDEQARAFLHDSTKNRVDTKAGALHLSSIFDWFKGDFVGKSGSVEKFIAPYLDDAERKWVEKGGFKTKYTDYDWSLNKQ
jgi:hypothetical protein